MIGSPFSTENTFYLEFFLASKSVSNSRAFSMQNKHHKQIFTTVTLNWAQIRLNRAFDSAQNAT